MMLKPIVGVRVPAPEAAQRSEREIETMAGQYASLIPRRILPFPWTQTWTHTWTHTWTQTQTQTWTQTWI
eukprot:785417-Alexandrium_andersonii.AAC.1